VGIGMVVTYIRAEREKRSRLDEWMTDAAKAIVKTYVKLRYNVDLGSMTPQEEREYWQQFGARVDAFVAIAEPIAWKLYQKHFVELTPAEQAIVARRVGLASGEPADKGERHGG
jgi:hypothetical protein